MPLKSVIGFIKADSPITDQVTKFGGQPNWLTGPQWPTSEETDNPMRFIGQIKLADVPGLVTTAQMAYLFMTDEEDGEFVDGTYEPDSGENAIVLQPGEYELPYEELEEGPTLYRMVEREGHDRLLRELCEFSVDLAQVDDVIFRSEEDRWELAEDHPDRSRWTFSESKLGGSPAFMQGDEIPFTGDWQFLLQLDSGSTPFYVNFGDVGVGYAFMNGDGTEAKFLWQCG